VPFAIKSATEQKKIETQVIKYITKIIDKKEIKIEPNFDWERRAANVPLIVFCNYSSRIGVDVEYALRGVQDPEVILIILHICRRALLQGDLSDTDYLLSEELKKRVAYIAHFAFDVEVYDCQQNNIARKKMCTDLKRIIDKP
ncbi:hypothetical protein QZH41_019890, partial [Actinostola sp. cb2023]